MMDDYLVVFGGIGVFVVLCTFVMMGNELVANGRTRKFQKVADELNAYFDNNPAVIYLGNAKSMFLFDRDHHFRDLLRFKHGNLHFSIFEYNFRVPSIEGDQSNAKVETVCLLRLEQVSLPLCVIRPRSKITGITYIASERTSKVDVVKSQEFSKRYEVFGADATAIASVISPGLVSFFENNRGLYLETNEDCIAFYQEFQGFAFKQSGTLLKPNRKAVDEFIALGEQIAGTFRALKGQSSLATIAAN